MIRALRILSRAVIAGFAVWLLLAWYVERADPPPQIQTAIEGEIDHILIEKSARRMTLFQNGQPVRVYVVALGFAPDGTKVKQGDGKTPEGMFKIDRRNAQSSYHLSLGINYPRAEDRARAAAGGYSPGGDIFIHGQPNRMPDLTRLRGDWTAGCIAVTNREIEDIYAMVRDGTPIKINP